MIKKVKYNQILILFIATALFSVSAIAQTSGVAEKIDKIEVTGLRSPDMMPYKDAYEFLRPLNAKAYDKIKVRIKIVPINKQLQLSDIKITLQGDKTSQPIPIAADGLIEVPISAALIDDHAEFVTNQKKDSIRVEVTLGVLPPANGPVRYRYLADALGQVRDSVKGFVPWYLRWLVPNNFNEVNIEFNEGAEGQVTVLAAAGKQVFKADKKNKIALPIDEKLINENPEVVFSSQPLRISAGYLPDMLSYKAQKPE